MPQQISIIDRDDNVRTMPRNELVGAILTALAEEGCRFFCECRDNLECPMYAHGFDVRARLHRHPGTGEDHDPDCPSFDVDDVETSGKKRRLPAIKDGPEADVKLAQPMVERPDGHDPPPAIPPEMTVVHGAGDKPKRDQTSLRGLLQFQIERAALNEHRPSQALNDWNTVARRLETAIGSTRINGSHLGANLLLPRLSNQLAVTNRVKAHGEQLGASARPYLFAIGSLSRVRAVGELVTLQIESSTLHLEMSATQWTEALRRSGYPAIERVIDAVRCRAGTIHVVLIARVTTNAATIEGVDVHGRKVPTVKVESIGLQVVTKDWIPADSGYEVSVINQAVAQGRHFIKPMRPTQGCPFVPDLIFLDTQVPQVYEILGLDDPDYLEHAGKKIPILNEFYGSPTIVWRAYRGDPMPAFPPRADSSKVRQQNVPAGS